MANEMNNKNMEELVRSIPILAATGNVEAVNRVLDLIEEMRKAEAANVEEPKVGKYFYARVLTLADGTKHYHPMVAAANGYYSPADMLNPDAYAMKAEDTILALQENYQATSMKQMAERAGYIIQAVYVTNEVYAELQQKLRDLMVSVIEGTRGGAMQIAAVLQGINDGITPEVIQQLVIKKATEKPYVSGAAVNADGQIVEKGEYIDEKVEPKTPDYSDDEYDDEADGCEGCDCECCGCDNCPGC
jgi:hypothetical protein